jgi:hypothetical protein
MRRESYAGLVIQMAVFAGLHCFGIEKMISKELHKRWTLSWQKKSEKLNA